MKNEFSSQIRLFFFLLKPFHFLVFAMLFSASNSFGAKEANPILKVMTYNIHGLPGLKHNKARMLYIGQKLSEMRLSSQGPDLVLIQEAFSPYSRLLVEKSGYPYVIWGPQNSFSDLLVRSQLVGSGLVILSRYPIEKINEMSFSSDSCVGWDCYIKKSVMMIKVSPQGWGHSIQILNTHMNSNKGSGASQALVDRAKYLQIQELEKFLNQNPTEDPIIFAGDFNSDIFWKQTKDQHFYRQGKHHRVHPTAIFKTMDELYQDDAPSDHLAYQVDYEVTAK